MAANRSAANRTNEVRPFRNPLLASRRGCRPWFRPVRRIKSVEFFAFIRKLAKEEAGQDATEYALLLGFVALASAAVFPTVTDNIKTIWSVASTHLSNAAKAVR